MHPTITLTDAPTQAAIESIRTHLNRHNESRSKHPTDHRPLALLLTDTETDEVLGGLWGWTSFSVLFTDLLFIPETMRGQGLGTQLLAQAEQEAIVRGCHTAWLDTFSFQAPDFYQRHGYAIFATIEDYPPGHTRFFLKKSLQPTPQVQP
jgi:GNAT superfamily N-acetyltransferase